VTVAAVKSKEDCNLQTNAAWGNESDWGWLGSLLISPQEPTVKHDIEGHHIDFVLDTGAAISTVTTPTGRLTKDSITIRGAPVLQTPRMHGQQTPGQAPVSVCARGSRPPSGKRLTF
jgi:hypothetical protein